MERRRSFFSVVLTAGLLLTTIPLFGQGRSDEVRLLNNSVLRLQEALQRADPPEQARIQADAADLLSKRAAALIALIKENPASALSLAFDQNLLNDLSASFPGSASKLEQQGTWEGTSNHIIFDDPDHNVRKYLVQIESGNDSAELYSAAGEPHCVSGDRLSAKGVRISNVIAAGNVNVQAGGGAVAQSLSCSTQGVQNAAVLLVQFPTISLPASVTPSLVDSIFFGSGGKSLTDYWQQSSFGKASATGSVFGPFTLDRTYTCDEYYAMRTAAIAAADSIVNFTNYTRVFLVFPNPGSCGWAGLGTLGCSTLSSADGNFQASTAWLLATYMTSIDQGVKLTTHEAGHNITLHHASSRDFGAEALGPVGAAGTLDEYGDLFNTMGSWNLGQYGAPHKAMLGWLTGTNVETVESNASRTIAPYEISTGALQALKVRRGTGNNAWLWLEYRQSVAPYDSTLGSQVFSGALVHYEDSTTGTHTHLIDFTPATTSFGDPALTGTWADPYTNLTLSVTSANASGLSVNVFYGAIPCTQAPPTATLSPASASVYSGSNVSYTATVVNHDSGSCAASTFNMSASVPGTWGATFNPSALTLGVGQSGSTQVTVSVPAAYATGGYSISVTATNGARSATANGTCNVSQPPPPPPPVFISSLTLSAPVVSTRDYETIRATVVNQTTSAPLQGASVTFRVTRPNNAIVTATVVTDAAGVAQWSYKPPQKGSYSVNATATLGGQSDSEGPKTFTAN